MNLLAKIKSMSDRYEIVASSLWTDEEKIKPITDVEGKTVLLSTDGTSWQYVNGGINGCWEQIDTDIDMKILNSIYPFIMSVNNSIYNDFVNCCFSKFYEDVTVTKNAENEKYLDINIGQKSDLQEGDFVYVVSCSNKYLTMVKKVEDGTVTVDNSGLNMRFKGAGNYLGLLFASFPPDYFQAVIDMFVYDLFKREDKEKRQERLGNYTYTNFEPVAYYGDGSYPKEMQEAIQYWQYIHV